MRLDRIGVPSAVFTVLSDVKNERLRQDEKWGDQHHPDLSTDRLHGPANYEFMANRWKAINSARVHEGCIAWDGILLEEVYEALAEEGHEKLRAELVQVAAVAVAWIEDIDSRVRVENVSD